MVSEVNMCTQHLLGWIQMMLMYINAHNYKTPETVSCALYTKRSMGWLNLGSLYLIPKPTQTPPTGVMVLLWGQRHSYVEWKELFQLRRGTLSSTARMSSFWVWTPHKGFLWDSPLSFLKYSLDLNLHSSLDVLLIILRLSWGLRIKGLDPRSFFIAKTALSLCKFMDAAM